MRASAVYGLAFFSSRSADVRASGFLLAVFLGFLLAACTAAETPTPSATSTAEVDRLVNLYNPNMWTPTVGRGAVVEARDAFTSPASDVARRVKDLTWFSTLVFIPFLVLPIALLLYVIFRFRDRGDGRPAATFMGNHTLELVWTAIPILALLLVSYPLWVVLDFMESPPLGAEEPLVVTVVGKSFAWDYEYKGLWKDDAAEQKQAIALGQDVTGAQEALVLPKGLPVVMNFTSNDVIHSWWIPAFGIKKDCIKGRFTRSWFTPDTVGVFKGQCAELCGAGHGIMLIAAVVVEPADFSHFVQLARHRDDARPLWTAMQEGRDMAPALAAYLAKADTPERRLALRVWTASHWASVLRAPSGELAKLPAEGRAALTRQRREDLDRLLASSPTASSSRLEISP